MEHVLVYRLYVVPVGLPATPGIALTLLPNQQCQST